jgi:hypothetical protein
MHPVTRRSVGLSLFTAIACLGCGADGVSLNPKLAEKRRRKMEFLQKRAGLKRKAGERAAR